jgi:hypothetical protein
MAYEDDERIINPEEQSNFFEEDPAYGTDTYFGERLDAMRDDLDLDEPEVDEIAEEDTIVMKPEEQEFGETLDREEGTPADNLDEDDHLDLEDDEPHV